MEYQTPGASSGSDKQLNLIDEFQQADCHAVLKVGQILLDIFERLLSVCGSDMKEMLSLLQVLKAAREVGEQGERAHGWVMTS